ncbi:MAG: hypothetical protein O2955_05830 [Planctomycetota bacterium]|nr:hypothetical protein [Planctomycetota bacterium]MDA1212013.1 hypothetical protein [Planctomycetota bacterium]
MANRMRFVWLLWILLPVAFVVGWPVAQITRYKRVSEPFSRVGAWLYAGGDNMGVPIYGPDGVHTVYFYDQEFGDAQLIQIKENLRQLPKLRTLHLEHTQITDAGIEQLTDLTLAQVTLYGTKVTAKGVERFRKKMPDCKVAWSDE